MKNRHRHIDPLTVKTIAILTAMGITPIALYLIMRVCAKIVQIAIQ